MSTHVSTSCTVYLAVCKKLHQSMLLNSVRAYVSLHHLNNRAHFLYLHSPSRWLCKLEAQSRVCITFENSLNRSVNKVLLRLSCGRQNEFSVWEHRDLTTLNYLSARGWKKWINWYGKSVKKMFCSLVLHSTHSLSSDFDKCFSSSYKQFLYNRQGSFLFAVRHSLNSQITNS